MAHVSPGFRQSGDSDRGQMILVGAFALALVFIVLALLLNSAIYTENVATRNNDLDTSEAIEFREEAAQAAGEIAAAIDDPDRATNGFNSEMNAWSERTSRFYAARGVSVAVSVMDVDTDDDPDTGLTPVLEVRYRDSRVQYTTTVTVEQ